MGASGSMTRRAWRLIGRGGSPGNSPQPRREGKVITAAGKAGFAAGVERFAQADRAFAVTSDEWDPDPWLLGTPGGTVDLRTGELRARPGRTTHHQQTAVAPAPLPTAPLGSLPGEATRRRELIALPAALAGYCLTGDDARACLFFVYGPGGNGKGVFLNTVAGILARLRRGRGDGHLHRVDRATSTRPTWPCCRAPAWSPPRKPRKAAPGPRPDQGTDRRRPDHRPVHAPGLLRVLAGVQADDRRQPQAGASQRR